MNDKPTIIARRAHIGDGTWYVMDGRNGYWTDDPAYARVFKSKVLARLHAEINSLIRVRYLDAPTKGETDET